MESGNTRSGARDIDSYIAQFPQETQTVLKEIRAIIREAAPDATETISYAMPTFDMNGHLVHFAAMKHHLGFYPTPRGVEPFAEELASYKTSKGSIQFPFGTPLPRDLIRRIVEKRVRDNTAKAKK